MFGALPIERIKYLLKGGRALDLGAGDLKFSSKFQEFGYSLDAVDIKDIVAIPGVNIFKQDMMTFDIKNYDLILARNSLPFTDAKAMIKKIAGGLNKNGVAFFTLFGLKDDWKERPDINFIDYQEAIDFIQACGLSIYRRSTEEGYGPTMKGDIKYWHMHSFLCTK
jgi:uncharacterized UPF0146 family protein